MAAKFEQRTAIAYRALRRRASLGAAMSEYALLLVAVLIIATAVVKTIRPSVNCNGLMSVGELPGNDDSSSNCGGGTAVASNADLGGSENDYNGGSGSATGGSGSGSSGSATSGGSGSSGSGDSSGSGASGSDSSSASNSFSGQVAGTAPKAIDLTLAKLSDDTYNATPKGADGFTPATPEQLAAAGITPDMLSDKNSGFSAYVYTDGKGDYVVAYRGTANLAGWKTDAQQALGQKTAQYSEALALANAAKNAWGNNVVVTGHSLGGGEAAAVAAATGLTGVTFNAAGVNDKTLQNEGLNPQQARDNAYNGQVRSYQEAGDPLSGAQNAVPGLAPQAVGRPIVIQDPHPYQTAFDRSLGLGGAAYRAYQAHGEFTQGMQANPVLYQGANGQTSQYSFSNPNNPS